MEPNSKKHFSFLLSIKRIATFVMGHPSILGTFFDASKDLDTSHASIIIFSVNDSCFSTSVSSSSCEFCMNCIYANKAGLKTTTNLENSFNGRYSSCGCRFLW
ncbi:hypothetical protein V8G54_024054 [Vigna mungo]|uniref:Uncharacterized protein n=1 Tax=Vigna mungo TaxID=3915 RepID=A0AAQ3N4X7_VIGMU